jgi:uncharacterized Zn finger protein
MQQKTIIPGLSEQQIKLYTTSTVYQRGVAYYKSEAVVDIVQYGEQIKAQVAGSQHQDYQVVIDFDKSGIQSCQCDCPYHSYCKHLVAVLLTCLHQPKSVEQVESLANRVQQLSKVQLCQLIEQLAVQDLSLSRRIHTLINHYQAVDQTAGQESQNRGRVNKVTINPKHYTRQVKDILHSLDNMRASEAYWLIGGLVEQIGTIIAEAKTFIEENSAQNAIAILNTVTR